MAVQNETFAEKNNGKTNNVPLKKKNNYYKRAKKQNNVNNVEVNSYEYNTSLPYFRMLLGDYMDSSPYDIHQIRRYAKNPQFYNKELRDLAWWAYHVNGSIRAAVNYACSMHTLDKVVVCRNTKVGKDRPRNFAKNRTKMISVLNTINYKQQIRDNIMKDANDGGAFYYFETSARSFSRSNFMSDYEVEDIVEINESGLNVSIIPLPVDWCKIVSIRNSSYVIAFDLRYFNLFNDKEREAKLRGMPKEIRDAYASKGEDFLQPWVVLDNSKTIVTKVNSSINQPWGVPMAVTAFDDIMYADYFVNTKRAVLDNVNNQIIYMTFPEGKEKGTSSLTRDQQREQHEKVKSAIVNRKNKSGISFFSLASGTKLDKIEVDIDIFDEKNESYIKDAVPSDLGISSASLDGNTKGNYATATLNLELLSGFIYTWIENYMTELNKCINANIIKDSSCIVDCYILPITFANRDKQVKYMKELYSSGKGSLLAWISAVGFDADAYVSLMDYELECGFEDKYPVHKTSYTISKEDENGTGDTAVGRAVEEHPTNENTIQSQSSNSNENPKPST